MTLLGCLALGGDDHYSAIIAKAGTKNALFPVLAFPLYSADSRRRRIDDVCLRRRAVGRSTGQYYHDGSHSIVVVSASTILFDFVWVE